MLKILSTTPRLGLMYLSLLLSATVSYSYFEGIPFIDSLWWSCVTAMTVGYGDMYPVTSVH